MCHVNEKKGGQRHDTRQHENTRGEATGDKTRGGEVEKWSTEMKRWVMAWPKNKAVTDDKTTNSSPKAALHWCIGHHDGRDGPPLLHVMQQVVGAMYMQWGSKVVKYMCYEAGHLILVRWLSTKQNMWEIKVSVWAQSHILHESSTAF